MIGETIGHFKIVSRLGQGGMGTVYAGEHESIQTRVAVKILHADVSKDTEHVQRFFNEAKIVGKIKHAGIVKIFDVGFFNGHAYLIMELLEGEPLSARIASTRRIGWAQTADLARQMSSVLDATHRAGVIHRDLKPDNTFLVSDHELASGERVKILDFGISKLSGTMAGNSPKTVGTMGTPAYMAPEQWGDSSTIDWRADAYSLGCVIFEMLCGRPPFEASTIYEACGKHMSSKPPAPREFAPETPEVLDALVLRLLAKDPAERAVSMAQVAKELDAIAKGEPPPPLTDSMRPPTTTPATTQRAATDPTIRIKPDTPEKSSESEPRPKTLTTLNSSAAQIHVEPPRRRSGWIAGGAAAAVVLAIVLFVAMRKTGDEERTSAPLGIPEPVQTQPPPQPAAQPQPVAQPQPTTAADTTTGSAAIAGSAATPSPTPTPTNAGSDLPQHVTRPHRPGPHLYPSAHPATTPAPTPPTPAPTPPKPTDDVGGRI